MSQTDFPFIYQTNTKFSERHLQIHNQKLKNQLPLTNLRK